MVSGAAVGTAGADPSAAASPAGAPGTRGGRAKSGGVEMSQMTQELLGLMAGLAGLTMHKQDPYHDPDDDDEYAHAYDV